MAAKTTTKKTSTKPKSITVSIELSDKEKRNEELAKGRLTSYTVKPEEQDTIHVELEILRFDASMNKTSTPYVQKFDKRAWLNFRPHAKSIGLTHVRVLYAPKDMAAEDLVIPEKLDAKK